MNLTLNERTYLIDLLVKYFPDKDIWDLTGVMTRPQRARLFALDKEGKADEIKEMLENIQAFQLPLKLQQ